MFAGHRFTIDTFEGTFNVSYKFNHRVVATLLQIQISTVMPYLTSHLIGLPMLTNDRQVFDVGITSGSSTENLVFEFSRPANR